MRTATLTLAGKSYEIAELPSRKNAAWRTQLQGQLSDVARLIEQAPETEIDNTQAAAGLLRQVGATLLGSIDTINALLFDYAPELAQDRERIESEAYDSELIGAFVEVLKLAYPFGQFAQMLVKFANGAAVK